LAKIGIERFKLLLVTSLQFNFLQETKLKTHFSSVKFPVFCLSTKSGRSEHFFIPYGHKYGRFSQDCKYLNVHIVNLDQATVFRFESFWGLLCFKMAFKLEMAAKNRCFRHNFSKIFTFLHLIFVRHLVSHNSWKKLPKF
jgi:hypothetical protein